MGSKKPKMDVTLYYMGVHMGLASAIDELVEIEVGKKQLWAGSAGDGYNFTFRASDLFGGHTKEGGIDGAATLMLGKSNQGVHGGLSQMLGGNIPAYRGLASIYYNGEICANSPYPKPWRFRMRRTESGWDDDVVWYREKVTIWMAEGRIKAMNPAHVMYMLWTQRDFRNLPTSRLDDTAWRRFADALYSEGFGMCVKISRQSKLSEFMSQVIDHVGGAQFVNRHTGLIEPVLIRGDYDADSLPLFHSDNGLLGIDEYASDAISGGINEVIVNYFDPLDNGNKRQVREKNLGSIHALGGTVNPTSFDYPGIPTSSLARRVARRELNALGGFIRRFKVRLDRRAARYVIPAGLIRISDEKRGIQALVLRIGAIDYGTFKSGVIEVEAALDVFGMPSTVYVTDEPSGYIPPDPTPRPITESKVIEASYRDLILQTSFDDVQNLPAGAGYMAAMAKKPTSLSTRYWLHDKVVGASGDFVQQSGSIFCASGTLAGDIDELAGSITLATANDLMLVEKGTAALIGEEVVRVDNIDQLTNIITIKRGCADTVPTKHSTSDIIWFYDGFTADNPTEYMTGVNVDVKLQPETVSDQLALTSITAERLKFNNRAARPYPPGQFKLNGQYYPAEIDTKDIKVTWAHRNRITQAEHLLDTTAATITPEANTLYKVELYQGNTLLSSETVDGLEHTFTTSATGSLRIVLKAIRDGLESWQAHEHTFFISSTKQPLTLDSTKFTLDTTRFTLDATEY